MRLCRVLQALLAAALLLIAVAWLRGAEYDEQYTLFLSAGVARPTWPNSVFSAGDVQALQSGQTSFAALASDLRSTDVHPPLYFWLMQVWRSMAGDTLFAARMVSVLCSLVTLWLVAVIARSAGIPAVPAVLLTAGCYGFAYTGAIARGFALAQMLNMTGVAMLVGMQTRRRGIAAGVCLGAATFTNYLAAFVGCAALFRHSRASGNPATAGMAVLGFAMWLPADLWFFMAQRQSRTGQFLPLDVVSALTRLAQYSAATVFGGLPLYLDGMARTIVAAALVLALLGLFVMIVKSWRRIASPETRLFAMAAMAPAIGLIGLGVVFNNTPIELRYLAFATPFIGLLLATLPRRATHGVLVVQAIALLGLMTQPETMQPARATAIAAAPLAGNGVVLLPRGNDGVGIVGAFAIESPPALRLLVIGLHEQPAEIRARASNYPRVVLALLGQDDTSRMTLPLMRQAFIDPCWRAAGEAFNVLVFDRICGEECACPADASPR